MQPRRPALAGLISTLLNTSIAAMPLLVYLDRLGEANRVNYADARCIAVAGAAGCSAQSRIGRFNVGAVRGAVR